MQRKSDKQRKKQTYEKPRLRIIELAAEEVLGAGCKQVTPIGGPLNPVSCITGPCLQAGT